MRPDLASRYGPVAVVAGASEGIGAAFAHALAAAGLDLVLVARREGPLEDLAGRLRTAFGVSARAIAVDLAAEDAAETIADSCRGLSVGLVVYNAAASAVGRFLKMPLEAHIRAVEVNARGPVLLAHRFGRAMAERGRGGIVLMSSLTAFQGTPLVASYGATKAFNLILAEGLWSELREHGIDVLACCAGATLTPGYERVTPKDLSFGLGPRPLSADDVAREALDALGRRPMIIPGRGNRWASFIMRRLLSRRLALSTMARAMRTRYDTPAERNAR